MIKNCDYFALVEIFADYTNYKELMSPTKKKLEKYCIKYDRTNKWAGTICGHINKDDLPIRHYYQCCADSIQILRQFDSFFDIENQMDISFYKSDECLLYTTSHEGEGGTISDDCYYIILNG